VGVGPIQSPNSPYWLGVDPGGKGAFGLAFLTQAGQFRTTTLSCADEALSLVNSCPLGVGVDSPLWWSSGLSADREADAWVRRTYKIGGGAVQASNSLRGAAPVQGAMFVFRLREKFPSAPVTEVHPKALKKCRDWRPEWETEVQQIRDKSEHEVDAGIAAIAAREGFEGRWSCDLSIKRCPSEQDPATHWIGPVHYFWPYKNLA